MEDVMMWSEFVFLKQKSNPTYGYQIVFTLLDSLFFVIMTFLDANENIMDGVLCLPFDSVSMPKTLISILFWSLTGNRETPTGFWEIEMMSASYHEKKFECELFLLKSEMIHEIRESQGESKTKDQIRI